MQTRAPQRSNTIEVHKLRLRVMRLSHPSEQPATYYDALLTRLPSERANAALSRKHLTVTSCRRFLQLEFAEGKTRVQECDASGW